MKDRLKNEKILSEEYYFDIDDNGLVELTTHNVAIAEAILKNDSSYLRACDINAGPEGNYGGSSAYWINELKKCDRGGEKFNKIIIEIVNALDRENSTHLNADGVGKKRIPRWILDKYNNRRKLQIALKKDDLEVYNLLSKKTKKEGGRSNKSFASKFCHYLSFYLFEKEEDRDKYPIYDSVIKKILPAYMKEQKIYGKYNLNNYKEYKKAIDEIIQKKNISRNGFDHLLWLYYKGR